MLWRDIVNLHEVARFSSYIRLLILELCCSCSFLRSVSPDAWVWVRADNLHQSSQSDREWGQCWKGRLAEHSYSNSRGFRGWQPAAKPGYQMYFIKCATCLLSTTKAYGFSLSHLAYFFVCMIGRISLTELWANCSAADRDCWDTLWLVEKDRSVLLVRFVYAHKHFVTLPDSVMLCSAYCYVFLHPASLTAKDDHCKWTWSGLWTWLLYFGQLAYFYM